MAVVQITGQEVASLMSIQDNPKTENLSGLSPDQLSMKVLLMFSSLSRELDSPEPSLELVRNGIKQLRRLGYKVSFIGGLNLTPIGGQNG